MGWGPAFGGRCGPGLPGRPGLGGQLHESADPEAIEKRIEELKVFYKEDHPDIQRQRRYLEKAIELKAQRESEAMEADKEKRKPAPPRTPSRKTRASVSPPV